MKGNYECRKEKIRFQAKGFRWSDQAYLPQEGATLEMGLCVGEADQEAGAPSGVQGVQGQGSETSEALQDPGDW